MAAIFYLVATWLLVIWHLSAEWSINSQYRYGWFVPLLVLYLVWSRTQSRPEPGEAFPRKCLAAAVIGSAAIEGVCFLFREANPDWRLLGLVITGTAICVTLAMIGRLGGWPWVGHFAFPVCFFLTAVPWPRPQEAALTLVLAHQNARIVAETLHWLGFDAMAVGNLVKTSAGVIGVDEACSGIRSLQGTLMVTLFLGEFFRLAGVTRFILLCFGFVLALLANIGRTTALGVLAVSKGLPTMERWHDTLGFTTLALGFVVALAGAAAMRGLSSPAVADSSRSPRSPTNVREEFSRLLPIRFVLWTGVAILGFSVVGTQAWYRYNEKRIVPAVAWKFVLPRQDTTFREVAIPERVCQELRFSFGESGNWTDQTGLRWRASYFEWRPGWNGEQTVLVHDPRVCLQSVGMQLVEVLPDFRLNVDGLKLSFEAYHFRESGQDVFVFNCVTDDVIRDRGTSTHTLTWRSRLDAMLAGVRHLGQRRVEIGIWGCPSAEEARHAFAGVLNLQLQKGQIAAR